MIGFTIFGVLVFWWACFELGYLLGWLAQVSDAMLRLWWLDRRVTRAMAIFLKEQGHAA